MERGRFVPARGLEGAAVDLRVLDRNGSGCGSGGALKKGGGGNVRGNKRTHTRLPRCSNSTKRDACTWYHTIKNTKNEEHDAATKKRNTTAHSARFALFPPPPPPNSAEIEVRGAAGRRLPELHLASAVSLRFRLLLLLVLVLLWRPFGLSARFCSLASSESRKGSSSSSSHEGADRSITAAGDAFLRPPSPSLPFPPPPSTLLLVLPPARGFREEQNEQSGERAWVTC